MGTQLKEEEKYIQLSAEKVFFIICRAKARRPFDHKGNSHICDLPLYMAVTFEPIIQV